MSSRAGSLTANTDLGRYRIEALIGAGGMGEVYVARDTLLGRRVALKILPPERSRDGERVGRFLREAEAASSLNHPAIVAIYDSGVANGLHFVAMELIEGETLGSWARGTRDRSKKLALLAAVADGLARAHAGGIVHRDFKPDNVMVARGGYPKILDFGIAKLTERGADNGSDTAPDALLGTAAYMAPEQIEGRAVDARADIFAFGCVLYEVITGRPAFRRRSAVETMHAILHETPAPMGEVPLLLERLVTKCLVKDPEERFQSIRDVALDLRELARDPGPPKEAPRSQRTTIGLAALLLVAVLAGVVIARSGATDAREAVAAPTPAVRPMAEMQRLTTSGTIANGAVSPDGKYVAFADEEAGQQTLWVKQIATGTSVRVVPPRDTYFNVVRYSPDGDYIYYSEAVRAEPNIIDLFRVPALGGTPQKIAGDMESWFAVSPDGKLVAFRRFNAFVRDWVLTVIDVATGEEREILRRSFPDSIGAFAWRPNSKSITFVAYRNVPRVDVLLQEVDLDTRTVRRIDKPSWEARRAWRSLNSFAWLPDGSGLIAAAAGQQQPEQVWFLPVDTGEPRRITSDISGYGGLTVTADSSAIVAVRGEIAANIWLVAGDKSIPLTTGIGNRHGLGGVRWLNDREIAYITSVQGEKPQLVRLPAAGGEPRAMIRKYAQWAPAIAPDGSRVAFLSDESGQVEVWTADANGESPKQLTRTGRAATPVFFPDGKSIAYVATGAKQEAWRINVDGTGLEKLTDRPTNQIVVSPDGRRLLCRLRSTDPKTTLWRTAIVPIGEKGEPRYFDVPRHGGPPLFDWLPDGRAFAFVDFKDGVSNLWVQSIDGGEPRQLTHFDSGRIFAYDIASDGKTVALSRGDDTTDLVLIRDFR